MRTVTRIENCPECHELCVWCAWSRKNARANGCGVRRRCEWGESAKGVPCSTCDGSGRVRATIVYERPTGIAVSIDAAVAHERDRLELRVQEVEAELARLKRERDAEAERIAIGVCEAFPLVAGEIDVDSGDELDGIVAAIRWLLDHEREQSDAKLAEVDRERARLEARASTLEDAAFHFQTCTTCARDGEDACPAGRQFAAFLRGEPDAPQEDR